MSSFSARHGRRPEKKLYHRAWPRQDHGPPKEACPPHSSPHAHPGSKDRFATEMELCITYQRHPNVFHVSGGRASRKPIAVTLTEKAKSISSEELQAQKLMEPILARNLRKLLMMSMDSQIPVEKIQLVQSELGLPNNFKNNFVPRLDHLCLEFWDSSLAVTAREGKLNLDDFQMRYSGIPKHGNIQGPFAFKLKYPGAFRPNRKYLEEVVWWQKMAFPSPYLNAR
ncbi:hypothetical protein BRADI_1g12853v3 [Brachypodium distachyon]|uniref:PORR domain-containing protein n=1 Tax=Brachypodium distachyon TaxID=15368 RepID=A0A0Q3JPJ8_BRADI|nr:hypothetical protein BRADI_1g12853v3 [Brachypodium distachyon]